MIDIHHLDSLTARHLLEGAILAAALLRALHHILARTGWNLLISRRCCPFNGRGCSRVGSSLVVWAAPVYVILDWPGRAPANAR